MNQSSLIEYSDGYPIKQTTAEVSQAFTLDLDLCWGRTLRRWVGVLSWVDAWRRLKLDRRLLAGRRLRTEVTVVLRVCRVLRRRRLVVRIMVVRLVWRRRAWRWCHPRGALDGSETVLATATSVQAAVFSKISATALNSRLIGILTRSLGKAGMQCRQSRRRRPSGPSDPSWSRSIRVRGHNRN